MPALRSPRELSRERRGPEPVALRARLAAAPHGRALDPPGSPGPRPWSARPRSPRGGGPIPRGRRRAAPILITTRGRSKGFAGVVLVGGLRGGPADEGTGETAGTVIRPSAGHPP